ncbi:hypothetical protein FWH58_02170 [Candidatus Saccharibacteria bacterium]|nr:hypothetical protein [Candidatus Saccharibacteria bacterium]
MPSPETTPPQPKTALEFLEQNPDLPKLFLTTGSGGGYNTRTQTFENYGFIQIVDQSPLICQQLGDFLKSPYSIQQIVYNYNLDEFGFINLPDGAKRTFWDIASVLECLEFLSSDSDNRPLVEIRYPINQAGDVTDAIFIDTSTGGVYHDEYANGYVEDTPDEEALALAIIIATARRIDSLLRNNPDDPIALKEQLEQIAVFTTPYPNKLLPTETDYPFYPHV